MKTEDPPKALSFIEVLRVVHASEVLNIDQHKLAAMYGINAGRIAEAVVALRWAAENHKTLYRHVHKLNQRKKRDNGKAVPEKETDPFVANLIEDQKLLNGSPH